jgi:hypothetical protein
VKVSSPVGDFPYTPHSLRYEQGGLVVEGAMGAWPATIRVEPSDVPTILALLPRALLVAIGAGALACIAAVVLRRPNSAR